MHLRLLSLHDWTGALWIALSSWSVRFRLRRPAAAPTTTGIARFDRVAIGVPAPLLLLLLGIDERRMLMLRIMILNLGRRLHASQFFPNELTVMVFGF